MKIHFWKILSFVGVMSNWAEDALQPDPDGVVRITVDEMTTLAEKACKAFGWKAEIVVHRPKKQAVPSGPDLPMPDRVSLSVPKKPNEFVTPPTP